jgi:hypothetical protein
MAKHTFKISSSAADAEPGGGQFYDGECPPAGVYTVSLKALRLKTNKNDDDMLNLLLEVTEKGKKAEFNGYGIWDNLNITDDQAGFVNQFLDSAGIPRKSFWPPNGPMLDNANPPNVTKIGTKRPEGLEFRVSTKRGEWKGEDRLEVNRYLPMKESDEDAAEDADEEAAEAAAEEAEEETAEDETTDEDEGGEEDAQTTFTEEELKADYDLDDLKGICDAWEIPYTAKATEKTLIKKILDLQAEAAAAGDEDESGDEDGGDEDDQAVSFTKEELKEYELDDLEAVLRDTFKVKKMPAPKIKPKLIQAILAAQEANGGKAPF